MNRVEELIQIERDGLARVSIKMHLNGRFHKTPYVAAIHAPRMLCRLIGNKMESLVRQRKKQVAMGYTGRHPQELQPSFAMLEYRLASRNKWNCQNLKNYLSAALPDLRNIAPSRGKYAGIWQEFIIGLELLIQEDDIRQKIHQQLGYE